MPLPQPLPDPVVEVVAHRLRVLGGPMRIKLLDRLREGTATVQELTEQLDATQQNVSQHLGLLFRAGMVTRKKEGAHAIYGVADDHVFNVLETVWGGHERQLTGIDNPTAPEEQGET